MYRHIVNLLYCPICGGDLKLHEEKCIDEEITEGRLCCTSNHSLKIRDGIIDFNSKEQKFGNTWSENYKELDFDELDRQIEEKTPDNLKKMYSDAILDIIKYINEAKPEYLVDIATGRGMLLTNMAGEINYNTYVICTDLSFEVLKYDRIKVKRINKNIKASFFACDATRLPIKENSIDTAVSFFGIQNMIGIMDKGIEECHRILKPGKMLINSYILVNAGTEEYNLMHQTARENKIELGDKFGTKESIDFTYGLTKFNEAYEKIIGEGIGEKSEIDLIPFENEWFKIVNMYSIKNYK